jgi:hypothetical protein
VTAAVLGLTALSWVLLIPAVLCWPLVGLAGYFIWRWSKQHEEADAAERRRLLEAAARSEPEPGGPAG